MPRQVKPVTDESKAAVRTARRDSSDTCVTLQANAFVTNAVFSSEASTSSLPARSSQE